MSRHRLPCDSAGRPFADRAFRDLIEAIARANASRLGPIDASRILFVAGGARREALASIRPLTFGGTPPKRELGRWKKPLVRMGGVEILYEICLRPRFFLAARPEARLVTVAHELWHVSGAFDGALHEERRHEILGPERIEREIAALDLDLPEDTRALLAFEGEIRLSAWLSRPPSRFPSDAGLRREYDERDLYTAIVEQRPFGPSTSTARART